MLDIEKLLDSVSDIWIISYKVRVNSSRFDRGSVLQGGIEKPK